MSKKDGYDLEIQALKEKAKHIDDMLGSAVNPVTESMSQGAILQRRKSHRPKIRQENSITTSEQDRIDALFERSVKISKGEYTEETQLTSQLSEDIPEETEYTEVIEIEEPTCEEHNLQSKTNEDDHIASLNLSALFEEHEPLYEETDRNNESDVADVMMTEKGTNMIAADHSEASREQTMEKPEEVFVVKEIRKKPKPEINLKPVKINWAQWSATEGLVDRDAEEKARQEAVRIAEEEALAKAEAERTAAVKAAEEKAYAERISAEQKALKEAESPAKAILRAYRQEKEKTDETDPVIQTESNSVIEADFVEKTAEEEKANEGSVFDIMEKDSEVENTEERISRFFETITTEELKDTFEKPEADSVISRDEGSKDADLSEVFFEEPEPQPLDFVLNGTIDSFEVEELLDEGEIPAEDSAGDRDLQEAADHTDKPEFVFDEIDLNEEMKAVEADSAESNHEMILTDFAEAQEQPNAEDSDQTTIVEEKLAKPRPVIHLEPVQINWTQWSASGGLVDKDAEEKAIIEAERIAAEKAAAEKAEAERKAAEKAAAEKAEAERKAAEKAAAEKAEAERKAAKKAAAEKAEAERKAAEKAAAEKVEAERIAAKKAAAEKAEAERKAAEKAAAEKAEAERKAAEKAAAEKAEAERKAAEKAAAEKAEAERKAAEKAEAEQFAIEVSDSVLNKTIDPFEIEELIFEEETLSKDLEEDIEFKKNDDILTLFEDDVPVDSKQVIFDENFSMPPESPELNLTAFEKPLIFEEEAIIPDVEEEKPISKVTDEILQVEEIRQEKVRKPIFAGMTFIKKPKAAASSIKGFEEAASPVKEKSADQRIMNAEEEKPDDIFFEETCSKESRSMDEEKPGQTGLSFLDTRSGSFEELQPIEISEVEIPEHLPEKEMTVQAEEEKEEPMISDIFITEDISPEAEEKAFVSETEPEKDFNCFETVDLEEELILGEADQRLAAPANESENDQILSDTISFEEKLMSEETQEDIPADSEAEAEYFGELSKDMGARLAAMDEFFKMSNEEKEIPSILDNLSSRTQMQAESEQFTDKEKTDVESEDEDIFFDEQWIDSEIILEEDKTDDDQTDSIYPESSVIEDEYPEPEVYTAPETIIIESSDVEFEEDIKDYYETDHVETVRDEIAAEVYFDEDICDDSNIQEEKTLCIEESIESTVLKQEAPQLIIDEEILFDEEVMTDESAAETEKNVKADIDILPEEVIFEEEQIPEKCFLQENIIEEVSIEKQPFDPTVSFFEEIAIEDVGHYIHTPEFEEEVLSEEIIGTEPVFVSEHIVEQKPVFTEEAVLPDHLIGTDPIFEEELL